MKDYLYTMEALVREDCKTRTFDLHAKMNLHSYTTVNGNIEAVFLVSSKNNLMLYQVIYFNESNEYRVFVFKLEEMLDI